MSKLKRERSPRLLRRLPVVIVGAAVAIGVLGAAAAVSMRAGEAKSAKPQPSEGPAANYTALRLAAQRKRLNTGQNGQTDQNLQTDQIRPLTQQEAQKLAAGIKEVLNQSTEGLKPVKHADGSETIDLQGRFQNVAVAKKTADGAVTQSCVDNPNSAAVFFGIDPHLLEGQTKPGSTSTGAQVAKEPKN